MNFLRFTAVAALFFAFSAQAHTYRCEEILKPSNAKTRVQKFVTIQELKNITKDVSYGKNFDAVYSVQVTVTEQVLGKTEVLDIFKTVAKSEDVNYTISAVKSHGIKIALFLDEADDAWMELTNDSGKKKSYSLHCE